MNIFTKKIRWVYITAFKLIFNILLKATTKSNLIFDLKLSIKALVCSAFTFSNYFMINFFRFELITLPVSGSYLHKHGGILICTLQYSSRQIPIISWWKVNAKIEFF